MIDLHIHSKFSPDAHSELEEHIKKSIMLGNHIIGFTEHFDYDYMYENFNVKHINFVEYFKEIYKLKEKYENKIEILVGAEFGYSSNINSQTLSQMIVDKYDIDYSINSIHLVEGEDLWTKEYFETKEKHVAYEKYLQWVKMSLSTKTDYQIVGHLGYCQRKAIYENKIMKYSEHREIIDEILKEIIKKDKVLEINSSTRGVCETIPSKEILERYFHLGGRLVSFGSDSHTTDRLFENYDGITSLLKSIGFKEYSYFNKRKIHFYDFIK